MKKKLIIVITAVILLAVSLVPVRKIYEDGGTKEYSALLYKVVHWNRITDTGEIHDGISLYFLPKNFKAIDDLWQEEEQNIEHQFMGKLIEHDNGRALVEVLENEPERNSSDRISFSTENLENIQAKKGDIIEITYKGDIMEVSPAKIDALSWKLSENSSKDNYSGQWINKEKFNADAETSSVDVYITEIYRDCFFGQPVVPMPYKIKFNGVISDKYCVGDQVYVTYKNEYYDEKNQRKEADVLSVETSTLELDPDVCYKPVIYLYPEKETDVSVELMLNGGLTCTYPQYNGGWKVRAEPDGTLKDEKGMSYSYLYWEGEISAQYDFSQGFSVKGEDTAEFLEVALEKLGLNRREANEFIVYWLPQMQDNPYNIISFQTDAYTEAVKLDVSPAPHTVIRVFMTWKASDEPVNIKEQILSSPERKGFTVVEWGGTEITD